MVWIDLVKGISILWIVFFHFFSAYGHDRFPWFTNGGYFSKFLSACSPHSGFAMLQCRLESVYVLAIDCGYHSVGVFLLLSGIGLTYSLARFVDPPSGWTGWYRDRLLRLYPMYWAAHIVYLITPFAWTGEPINYRFLLSLRRSFLPGRNPFLLFEYCVVVFRPAHSTVLSIPGVVPDASEDWSGPFPGHNRTRNFDFPLSPALRIPCQR